MNLGELRELTKDLPDDTEVFGDTGNIVMGAFIPAFTSCPRLHLLTSEMGQSEIRRVRASAGSILRPNLLNRPSANDNSFKYLSVPCFHD